MEGGKTHIHHFIQVTVTNARSTKNDLHLIADPKVLLTVFTSQCYLLFQSVIHKYLALRGM